MSIVLYAGCRQQTDILYRSCESAAEVLGQHGHRPVLLSGREATQSAVYMALKGRHFDGVRVRSAFVVAKSGPDGFYGRDGKVVVDSDTLSLAERAVLMCFADVGAEDAVVHWTRDETRVEAVLGYSKEHGGSVVLRIPQWRRVLTKAVCERGSSAFVQCVVEPVRLRCKGVGATASASRAADSWRSAGAHMRTVDLRLALPFIMNAQSIRCWRRGGMCV